MANTTIVISEFAYVPTETAVPTSTLTTVTTPVTAVAFLKSAQSTTALTTTSVNATVSNQPAKMLVQTRTLPINTGALKIADAYVDQSMLPPTASSGTPANAIGHARQ